MATEVLTGFVLVYCEYLEMFLDIPLTQSKLVQLTELRGVAKAIPKKKAILFYFMAI